jgi:ribosome-associated protein
VVSVGEHLDIPETELEFATSRSSGPGGQNVNKVNTRVTISWNVDASPSITDDQRTLLRERLGGRISKEGALRVSSQKHRTQLANREAAIARLAGLVGEALSEAPPRVAVGVPASADQKRLRQKRQRGRLKRQRSDEIDLDE